MENGRLFYLARIGKIRCPAKYGLDCSELQEAKGTTDILPSCTKIGIGDLVFNCGFTLAASCVVQLSPSILLEELDSSAPMLRGKFALPILLPRGQVSGLFLLHRDPFGRNFHRDREVLSPL